RWPGRGSGGRSECAPPPSGSARGPRLQAGQQGPAPDAGAYPKRSSALGGRQQSKLAAPPLGLGSVQVAPALSSLRSPIRRSAGPPGVGPPAASGPPPALFLHPGVQGCLGRLHLAGPLLELSFPLRRPLLQGLE